MEYSIGKLAKLSGVSARTLRYYEEIGLLSPQRTNNNDYRIYGQHEVDLLQQILFFREFDVPLAEIKEIVCSQNFDSTSSLERHLSALLLKREQIDTLLANVKKSLSTTKGDTNMNNSEKFEGFKKGLIDENEKKYGKEIRAQYGEEAVEKSNSKLMGLSQEQYAEVEQLSLEINKTLKEAFEQGDPSSELAQAVCELHKKWLCFYWTSYSKEAHSNLAQTYVNDPRFAAYYDKIADGCAVFLRDALLIYCSK